MSIDKKVIQLTKEEFFVKLFDYDNDFTLSNNYSSISRFYENKNIKIEYYIQQGVDNKMYFFIKPKIKDRIGFKIGGTKNGRGYK